MEVTLQQKAVELALKHGEALAKDLLVELAFPALKLAVEKSENKMDDAILMALELPLKAAVMDLADKIFVPKA